MSDGSRRFFSTKNGVARSSDNSISAATSRKIILEREVKKAVRAYVEHRFPVPYLAPKKPTSPDRRRDAAARSLRAPFQRSTVDMSPAKSLARLNGFQLTYPKRHHRVFLAEGVLARPEQARFGASATYSLYVKPSEKPVPKGLPPMIPKDITIYRILENRVEEFLYGIRQGVRDWISSRIVAPIERLMGRSTQTDKSDEDSVDVDHHVTTLRLNESTGQLQIISHVQPHHYTLLLPFELEHKPASTLITVSLVIFGAVPLAYRSLSFVQAYPGLSQTIVASVIATVGYGIWSSRSVARTNQRLRVLQAISRRVEAQDEAAWVVLQDGASRELTRIILKLYQGTPVEDGRTETSRLAEEIASGLGLVQDKKPPLSFEAAIRTVRENSDLLLDDEQLRNEGAKN